MGLVKGKKIYPYICVQENSCFKDTNTHSGLQIGVKLSSSVFIATMTNKIPATISKDHRRHLQQTFGEVRFNTLLSQVLQFRASENYLAEKSKWIAKS